MPLGKIRRKVLYGIGAARGRLHRYTVIRWIVGAVFTLAIALLPWTNTLRFDLWGGHHHFLGEPVDFVTAAKRFAFPFLAVNVVIIVVSRFLGRYLCGFVCPWGSLARLSEWFRFRDAKRIHTRLLRSALLFAICVLLSAITFSFWVDWRVFVEGSPTAIAVSGVFLGSMVLGLYVGVRRIGIRFCRDWCPSGVYFAVLGPETSSGIEFAHPENCTECKACEKVCPMDLMPTQMLEQARDGIGFYPGKLSAHALCIRCGDCVVACEATTQRDPETTPLRLGWLEGEGEGEGDGQRAVETERSAVAPAEDERYVG